MRRQQAKLDDPKISQRSLIDDRAIDEHVQAITGFDFRVARVSKEIAISR